MRKHFILLLVLFFAGVFFTSVNKYDLKACGTNTVACKAIKKKEIKNMAADQVEDIDPSMLLLINPLIQ